MRPAADPSGDRTAARGYAWEQALARMEESVAREEHDARGPASARGKASGARVARRSPPRPPAPRPRRRRRRSRVRRVRRVVAAAALLVLGFEGGSYARYMSRPSNVSFGVRSVEWVRADVSSGLVDQIERTWYSWTAPSSGGPALRRLPTVGVGGAVVTTRAYVPPRIRPRIQPALPGEGAWRATGPSTEGGPPVLVTTFRPDPTYPRLVAGVAWIDQKRARTVLYPGRYEPPGSGPRGPMEVPPALRDRLVATFNSGFRVEDSHGGVYANGTLWAPLRPGMATAVGLADGRVDVRAWNGGPRPGPGVVFARQNLPLIVDGGRPNPNLSDGPAWGATLGNAIRVWRSGLGVDRRGDLIYAVANEETVGGLAQVLIDAGAVRAMELDINSAWVTFISYGHGGARDPTKLLSAIDQGGTRYLNPDDRDFFAVYARGPLTPMAPGRG